MSKKVRFNLKSNTDDPSLILLKFRWDKNEVVLSCEFSVSPKHWDRQKQRVKSSEPRNAQYNAIISRMESVCLDLYWQYKAAGQRFTRDEFKERLLERLDRTKDEDEVKPVSLFEFIENFIEERRQMNAPEGTIKVYVTALKHLREYGQARHRKIDFSSITPTFKHDFISYLFAKNFKNNYVSKMLATIVTMLNEATKRGYCEFDNAKIGLSMPEKDVDTVYLNDREIKTLFNLELDDRLARVRDLFLIGCLTGLRFSDYSQIKPENIRLIEHDSKEVQSLKITTQKTKQTVNIPLVNPMLLAILERNNMKAPKALSNQKMNEYLKELCDLAGFDTIIEVNEFIAGRHIKTTKQKKELISSHTARRSFATNAYKAGMPVTDIMKFTGHATVASFMKYIRLTNEETAVKLADHKFFTGER